MKWGKHLLTIFILLISLMLVAACSKTSNDNAKKTPDNAVSLTSASEDIKAIYNARCINCHATDLSGKMGEKTNLQLVHERLTKEEIATVITEGRGRMPSFANQLSTEEIDSLAGWLSKQ